MNVLNIRITKNPQFWSNDECFISKRICYNFLKLGYIDGKYFSTDKIAEFLGIDTQEVIDTTKKALLLYKENINQFIDNTIQIATREHETTPSPIVKSFNK